MTTCFCKSPHTLLPSLSQHPSTSEETLLTLQQKHVLPGIILEHRHLNKLLRSYINPFVVHATKRGGNFAGTECLFSSRSGQ
jgi:DNA polymerase I-like protein with 3'-5' exonuclease and polymerase domains